MLCEIASSVELLVCARACVCQFECVRAVRFFPLGPTDCGDARDVLYVRISLFQLRLVNRRERRPPSCGDWCGGCLHVSSSSEVSVFKSSLPGFRLFPNFRGPVLRTAAGPGARIVCMCAYPADGFALRPFGSLIPLRGSQMVSW